jgi:hypothetical protein
MLGMIFGTDGYFFFINLLEDCRSNPQIHSYTEIHFPFVFEIPPATSPIT